MSTTEVPLTGEDLSELLAHWEVGTPVSAESLTPRGHVVKLAFPSGQPLVLKDTGPTAERSSWNYAFHARVLAHLDACGIGVPLHIHSGSGDPFVDWRDRRYTLARFQESGRRPTGPDERRLLYRNVGAAIARFHGALAAYPHAGVGRETQPEDVTTRSLGWTEELVAKVPSERRGALVAVTEDLMPRVHEALGGQRHQLIHRDLHPANLLTAGTAAVGFIDCDHFCTGPRLLDVAYYALSLQKWARSHGAEIDYWPGYLRALIDGYDNASYLTDSERQTVPYLMVAMQIRFAVWLFDLQPVTLAREIDTLAWIRDHLDDVADHTLRRPH